MKMQMPQVRTVELVQRQVLVIDGSRQASLRVLSGAAWLTQEDEAGDSVVHTGAEVALGGGRTLVEALGPARVQVAQVSGPRAAAWARAWRAWRRQRVRWQFGPVTAEGCS